MRALASAALFPLLVSAMAAFSAAGSGWDLAALVGLPPAANASLLSFAAVASFYPLVALLERLQPHRREWMRWRADSRADLLHLLLTGPLSNALFGATLAGVAAAGGAWLAARVGAPLWPARAPVLAQLFLAIAVAELGHYAFHRLSHENAWLWRLHATHHSAPRLYWLNATRFHPFDLFALIACQNVPLILLGAPARTFLAYTLFAVVYGQLQHANLELRTPRALDCLFSSPGVHRWHHSSDAREGNHNYGAILSVWDLAFGTFLRPRDHGFAGPVGIGELPAFPQRYLAQLATPFRWRPGDWRTARARPEAG